MDPVEHARRHPVDPLVDEAYAKWRAPSLARLGGSRRPIGEGLHREGARGIPVDHELQAGGLERPSTVIDAADEKRDLASVAVGSGTRRDECRRGQDGGCEQS